MGINGGRGIVGSGSVLGGSGISLAGGGNDPDAQAFIDAAGITGETQQLALNQLVLDLKGTGSTTNNTDVWSKIYAAYPFCPIDDVTANAACYKWNLKDSRDLDAAFRLTFTNTPVYSLLLGLEQNASANGYANTYFIESANMTAGNNGITASLSRASTGFNKYLVGSASGAIFAHRNSNTYGVWSASQIINTILANNIFTSSRLSATDYSLYTNGVFTANNNASSATQNIYSCYILAQNWAGTAGNFFEGGATDFIALHDGLTANESRDIYDAIAAYKTALGR